MQVLPSSNDHAQSPFNRKAINVTPETLHCFDNNAKNIRVAMKSYIKKCFLFDLFQSSFFTVQPFRMAYPQKNYTLGYYAHL